MIKKVMKRDRPMMIWLAGLPCSERAVRTKESTITIRVKQVMSRMIDGASVSNVIVKRICTAVSTCCGWFTPGTAIFRVRGARAERLVEAAGGGGAADIGSPARSRRISMTNDQFGDLQRKARRATPAPPP